MSVQFLKVHKGMLQNMGNHSQMAVHKQEESFFTSSVIYTSVLLYLNISSVPYHS